MPAPARRGRGRSGRQREPGEYDDRFELDERAARRRAAQRSGRRGDRSSRSRDAQAPQAPRKRSDLLGRVAVAVPAAVLAIAFVKLGGIGWTALAAVMGGACASELYNMLQSWRPATLAGIAVIVGMCFAAYYGGEHAMLGVGVGSVVVIFLAVLARGPAPHPTLAIASTLLGVVWIGFAVAHAVLLRDLPHGAGLVIDVLVGTFLADTFAYFGGRMFGHRKLAPEISPNKTVEGLLFGMVAAILAVFCAGLYQPWLPHGTAMALGVTIAVFGPLGDLFESMLKRDAHTKDAGNLFGAHGGALDRLDAVSFTLVACYYVWIASGH